MPCMVQWVSYVLSALAAFSGWAQAQSPAFPTKPIRMVVTAAPGGITDIMTRIMQEQIARGLGQPMIVENKPGAAGAIAVEHVVKSAPDGYTLVIVNVGNAAIVPWIRKDLPYDPLNDLAGVAVVAEVPLIVAINSDLPVRTLREFIDYAKRNPGKINYGSAGNASMTHLAAEVLAHLTGISIVHVPYKGAAPATVDLAGGRIQLGMIGMGSAKGPIAAGQVRVLAVAAPTRLAALPEVPTFEQAGVSGYAVTNWFGVLAPKGTPRHVIQTLNSHMGQAFENPQVEQRLADVGILPIKESVDQFQKRIISEHAKWRDIVRNAGIKAQ
jgi:tripartite-type tricarboxylate transporter receptor subunit TctC